MKRMFFIILCLATHCLFAFTDMLWQATVDHIINDQKEIVIIVPTYNNSRYDVCIKNITSILQQEYDNFHVYIIDDCSTDDTLNKLQTFLATHPRADKVTLLTNKKRVGAMANYYAIIHELEDHVIVINVDGDDWLAHSQVLNYINNVYQNSNIWITYGQYVEYPSKQIGFCCGYPAQVIKENSFRKNCLPISHLRTYYAWLLCRLFLARFRKRFYARNKPDN